MTARPGSARRPMVRRTLLALPWLLVAPALGGQQPSGQPAPAAGSTPASHTVKRGDTLWGLAQQYMGDPFRWPDIYRLNTDRIDDPHWIYPGEVLRLPGAGGAEPEAAARDTAAAQNAGDTVAVVRSTETVFSRRAAQRAVLLRADSQPRPSVPAALLPSVPFMDRRGGPAGAGRIVGSAEVQERSIESADRTPQIRERLVVTPPEGSTPRVGDSYIAYTLGAESFGVGQVVEPTALLRVESVDRAGTTVRVIGAYGRLRVGQGIVAWSPSAPAPGARPAPVANGISTTVLRVVGDPALPSLQRFVILRAAAGDGVRVGDLFTFVRPPYRDSDGVQHPEEELGTAEAVRVTPQGVTAEIVRQRSSAIGEGTVARLVARMPSR